MDPPDRVSGGRDRSESVAVFRRNLEASVRSRDTDAASHTERELIEAGLN
jgi:hypothetical protein